MPEPIEHVLAGFTAFGLRRCRALCSCGHTTGPVEGSDGQTREDAARRLLTTEHGARGRRPGETVGFPYGAAPT